MASLRGQDAFCTLPERKQRVQILIRLAPPEVCTRIRCKFGFQRRFEVVGVADGVAVARPLATDVAAFSHGLFLNGRCKAVLILCVLSRFGLRSNG